MLRKICQLPRQLGWGRVSVGLSIAAFLLATFAFSDLASARPLFAYDAAVWNVSDRIGIRTDTPDANTVLDATRSGADTYIKSRNALLGAYFQTQSGVNWAGYNMLNPAGATAIYFGFRGSTQFRVFDSIAGEDRILMDAAGTTNGRIFLNPGTTGRVGIGTSSPGSRLDVQTASGNAVWGETTATSGTTYGVYGQSDSTNGRGVMAWATATSGQTHGVYGQSDSTSGRGVFGRAPATTGSTIGVLGQSISTSGYGVYGEATAGTGLNYGVVGWSSSPSGYGVYFVGGLAGTGAKSAIVETQDYGWRTLYTLESPQNWFEDFGQATLVAGEAVVSIEPIFAQTVNLSQPYHVFLTPLGDCGLYVAEQTATSFTVRALNGATCDVGFSYRIVAPRLGYEDLRLAPAAAPEAVAASLPPAE